MVGRLKLVLDDDLVLAVRGHDVGRKRPYSLLGSDELEVEADRLAKQRQVLLLGEPGREVLRLVLPEVPNLQRLQPAKGGRRDGCFASENVHSAAERTAKRDQVVR